MLVLRLDFYEGQLPLGILDMADRTALHCEMSEVFAGGDVSIGLDVGKFPFENHWLHDNYVSVGSFKHLIGHYAWVSIAKPFGTLAGHQVAGGMVHQSHYLDVQQRKIPMFG
jgi:hypothetical protein